MEIENNRLDDQKKTIKLIECEQCKQFFIGVDVCVFARERMKSYRFRIDCAKMTKNRRSNHRYR